MINKNRYKGYGRFFGLASQMLFTILFFVYAGYKLDEFLKWDFPVFTIVLSFVGVGMAIYAVVRQLLNRNKKKK